MEKAGTWDQETVISELTRGREFANQLQKELNPAATSREACVFLLERILSSYDNALTLLDYMALLGNGQHPSKTPVFNTLYPRVSFEGNHRSEASLTDSKDQVHVSKKRKTSPKSSELLRVCSGTGVENDGYNWRKYGQKDIQGTSHPRAYFRCTHRHTQGCLATKQVQQIDGCPSTFDVIYRGKHTCKHEMMKHSGNIDFRKKHEVEEESTKPAFKVEIQEKFNEEEEEENFLDFSFPTTPVSCENMGTPFCTVPGSFIESSYSPPFLTPATSESYFSLSTRQMNDFGIDHNLPSSESDFTEIISNPTPLADFPPGDLDFLINFFDFDTPTPLFLDAFDCFQNAT
ncbi:probable WRKY transcription factor 53 [Henckelia pumila]|uniref:probable WRKY transcription factor 53 n=1 Tax=Henckelia pumila TaxID=405737 RepID=UPI003C6E9937